MRNKQGNKSSLELLHRSTPSDEDQVREVNYFVLCFVGWVTLVSRTVHKIGRKCYRTLRNEEILI